jgi:protein O-mannosyl-transferase
VPVRTRTRTTGGAWAVAAGLALATLATFSPVLRNGFIDSFDDATYVTENPHVRSGLRAENLRWALTTATASNWHPVTWVSHMIDCGLYGLRPAGHHRTSLLLHIANTLLLFVALRRMTGSVGRSAFAAALFALHPLRVESVAWVAERKDVLGGFFFMSALWAYARYAEVRTARRYALVTIAIVLGLASKPMLVTLPFVLILLDVWPLGRSGAGALSRSWTEKIPWLALSACSCVVTVWAQTAGGAMRSLEQYPVRVRLANAVVAAVAYIGKLFWPVDLAVIYPHPGGSLPGWRVAAASLLLAAITGVSIRLARRHPYLLVGWLWYLGMLVPVIGLVQVGQQAMADRYTYLPSIGLVLMLVWGLPELLGSRLPRPALIALACGAVLALAVRAHRQAELWRDARTLFTQAIRVTRNNYVAQSNLGLALYHDGKAADALEHFEESVRIAPGFEAGHSNLGVALADLGRSDEALTHYRKALELDPTDADVHNNLGSLFYRRHRLDEAVDAYREAIRFAPDHAGARYNLGTALAARGDLAESADQLRQAIRLSPSNTAARANLATVLYQRGDYAGAWREVHACRALGFEPPAALVAQLADRMPEPR